MKQTKKKNKKTEGKGREGKGRGEKRKGKENKRKEKKRKEKKQAVPNLVNLPMLLVPLMEQGFFFLPAEEDISSSFGSRPRDQVTQTKIVVASTFAFFHFSSSFVALNVE